MNSICLLRLSALGDVTHVLPVVSAIRSHWPECRITWIIARLERKLLEGLPGVEFVTFDKSRGLAAYRDLRRELGGPFDALLHMQLSFRANLAAWQVRAARRIGYDRKRSRELHGLRLTDRIDWKPGQHVLDSLADFLGPLGITSVDRRWQIPVSDEDRAFASEHLDPDRPALIICPCSSHRLRNWLPERYAAAADHAVDRGFQVVLCGGPSDFEREFARKICAAAMKKPLDLTGQDTLKQLAAILEAADVVLAPDTGPAHIANAMGTPVIGLYAATDPKRSGPYDSIDL
ncbi:MAG: glycosyltransferase family 9 protein, partial [Xanthomonadales bacterium]|nr:glycosyltransferase family 9 protein [Xanthomonadales bacterium]